MKSCYINTRGSSDLSSRQDQQGWMMIEVLLCLALLSVVLHLAQTQSETQWQSLQRIEIQRKLDENQQKQAAMTLLAPSAAAWLNKTNSQESLTYPDCEQCTGSQLERWFYASQHLVSDVE